MTSEKQEICIIIPSLNPDQKLINLLYRLREAGYSHIILINDGSSAEYDSYFQQANDQFQCCVLRHCVNQGKGRALKTGLNYFLEHFSQKAGVVTVDADGQHQVDDITACAQALLDSQRNGGRELILGCRDFESENVPLRSKFGNVLTRQVFHAFCGINISDTQTGLRAIPTSLVRLFLHTSGERYEYETNMLIDCKQHDIPIVEVPIKTVYLEENASSHFNPLLDSVRIYMIFFKFILSSLSSFLIDIVFFTLFTYLFKPILPLYYILAATAFARVISSAANYLINKHGVFRTQEGNPFALLKYYTLAIIQMFCSAALVTVLHSNISFANESVIKMFVDTVLFLLSFKIQQNWVFNGKKEGALRK